MKRMYLRILSYATLNFNQDWSVLPLPDFNCLAREPAVNSKIDHRLKALHQFCVILLCLASSVLKVEFSCLTSLLPPPQKLEVIETINYALECIKSGIIAPDVIVEVQPQPPVDRFMLMSPLPTPTTTEEPTKEPLLIHSQEEIHECKAESTMESKEISSNSPPLSPSQSTEIESEYNALKILFEAVSGEADALRRELMEYRQKVDIAESKLAQLTDSYQNELNQQASEMQAMTSELTRLRSHSTDTQDFIDELKRELVSLGLFDPESDNFAFQKQLITWLNFANNQLEEAEELYDETRRIKNENERLKGEMLDLKVCLEEERANSIQLEAENGTLSDRIQSTEQQCAALMEEKHQLSNRVEQLTEMLTVVEEDNLDLGRALAHSKQELLTYVKDMNGFSKENILQLKSSREDLLASINGAPKTNRSSIDNPMLPFHRFIVKDEQASSNDDETEVILVRSEVSKDALPTEATQSEAPIKSALMDKKKRISRLKSKLSVIKTDLKQTRTELAKVCSHRRKLGKKLKYTLKNFRDFKALTATEKEDHNKMLSLKDSSIFHMASMLESLQEEIMNISCQ